MKILSTIALVLSVVTTSISSADIVNIDLGSNASVSLNNAINGGVTVDNTAAYIVSGTMPSGISFDLIATATDNSGSSLSTNAQTAGTGVAGGQAASGIDNNFNAVPGADGTLGTADDLDDFYEEMTFTISNVVGGTVVFNEFWTEFGTTSEFLVINNGSPVAAGNAGRPNSDEGTHSVSGLSFTVRAASYAEQPFDNRFVIDQVGFDVVAAVPEPSTLGFLAIGLAGLIARRRRS